MKNRIKKWLGITQLENKILELESKNEKLETAQASFRTRLSLFRVYTQKAQADAKASVDRVEQLAYIFSAGIK